MRSTIAFGIVLRSTKLRWPSSASGYGAMRRPSAIDSVFCTVRPRSAGALAPLAKLKPVFQPCWIVPALFADRRWTASETVLIPRSSSVSALRTVTGEGVSRVGAAKDRARDDDFFHRRLRLLLLLRDGERRRQACSRDRRGQQCPSNSDSSRSG